MGRTSGSPTTATAASANSTRPARSSKPSRSARPRQSRSYDGANIWVPNESSSTVSLVRASNGIVLRTLTGNGLAFPVQAAFDGERVLVTSYQGDAVSLWKAADLSVLGTAGTGSSTGPWGATSDGVNFFLSLSSVNKLARF